MDRKQRPVGREKNVGTGKATIHKRGEGVGSSGPQSGKINSRPGSAGQSGRGGQGGGQSAGSGQRSGITRAGGLGKMLPLVVVVVVLYFLFGNSGGSSGGSQSGSSGPSFFDYYQPSSESGSSSGGSGGSYGTGGTYNEAAASNGSGTVNSEVAEGAREKYTKIIGGGKDRVTVMVYMCGTDLESNYGMATSDLNEMASAKIDPDKVNVIVYTGGCSRWKNSVVSSSTNQIYRVKSGGVEKLESNIGSVAMTYADTLSSFINYTKEKFPADRYELILWDHGGGTLSGYGYDEKFRSSGSMMLYDIVKALKNGGTRFDFIGYDACLMANLENAMAIEPFADYLIASEETEPGYGWYYTDWLTKLSSNTSIDTLSLGKVICDTFTTDNAKKTRGDSTTLSVIDLAEAHGTIPQALSAFSKSLNEMIRGDGYQTVANARQRSLEFASSERIDQIDLIDFCDKLGTKESAALAKALRGIVKYNMTCKSYYNAYGVSVYFPYRKTSYVSTILKTLNAIGFDSNYTEACKNFASLLVGGQVSGGGTSSPAYSLFGGGYGSSTGSGSSGTSYGGADANYEMIGQLLNAFLGARGIAPGKEVNGLTEENSEWLNTDLIREKQQYYSDNSIVASELVWTVKNGKNVLKLSDEQWNLIESVELNVFVDDGGGYLNLGLDNVMEFDEDYDLVGSWDGTWMTLNGQVVPYYMLSAYSDGSNYNIIGKIPAILNGETHCYLIVTFSNLEPKGTVVGISTVQNTDSVEAIMGKITDIADPELVDSTIEFVCDYYHYDGTFEDGYRVGEPLTITKDMEFVIENLELDTEDGNTFVASYCLTDVYDNSYWTPVIPQ